MEMNVNQEKMYMSRENEINFTSSCRC